MVLAGRHRKVSHSFHAEFIPGVAQIIRLVELHLVCYNARAELLIGCVLQVPACLALLHVFANSGTRPVILGLGGDGPPDLQILRRVAIFLL